MAAKAEGVGQRIGDLLLYRLLTVVQIALLIRYSVSYCSMKIIFLQFLDTGDEFHSSRCSQQMADHGFGGINMHIFRMIPEGQLDGSGFKQIVQFGSGSMRIDIGHFLRSCLLYTSDAADD